MKQLCGLLGPDDGVDPRDERRAPRRRGEDRKTLQLCAAVGRVVDSVLSGECGDTRLSACCVADVIPAPNERRLRVIVRPPDGEDPAEVLDTLSRAAGRIRGEVSRAIHRKRTPELQFALLPPEREGGHE